MSKAKQQPEPMPAKPEEKGFLALAGEAFSVLGEEIVQGKNKVVEVAVAKITSVKKSIDKITHKKKATRSRKAAPKKGSSAAKKAKPAAKKGKPAAKKAKPAARKAKPAPKKAAKKKAVARKR
jgi:hypothetical protein